MNRVWLDHYPAGIGFDVDTERYPSLAAALEDSCDRFADRTAFTNMDTALSYGDVQRLSRDFAAYLQTELGMGKGDRIAIMMPNCLQYVVALFGAIRAGLVVVNVNPLYTARELEHQLADSGAEAIVVMENFAATLEKVKDTVPVKTVITTQLGDMLGFPKRLLTNLVVKHVKKLVPKWDLPEAVDFGQVLTSGARADFNPPELGHDDLVFLQYTGGTTGPAKGAMLSHGNLVANLQQCHAWFQHYVNTDTEEVIITALPMYHVFALTVNTLIFFTLGGKNVLITNPRDMPGFVKELGKHPFTAITGVNTLFNGLLNTPGFEALDFSTLKFTMGGGMAVQKPVAQRWKQVTGVPIVEGYGLSETSPVATCNRLDLEEFNHAIGLPIPGTDVAIRDDDNNDVPMGESGELCIKGPQVMQGYWNKPEANEEAFSPDGYFRTGDIARMDEKGYFYIVDRKKDMILVSGFNVFPNEIEDVVAGHPGVLEGAAIGVPDDKSGEAVKLFVVKKDPGLTEQSVRDFCKENLTGYKQPKYVDFIDEVPKSPVGKILRRQLR
ncbi:AMP-binding protein [Spectribacter hydrogenooxidans]|uniref:Long-chain-fatty-acid--CoA ligase n=1 Tax=Spectribacter hydrogenoxidans TaxID=3075608 RepID=A0ABU3BWU6_9GAMM|nr:AMP-binding protein [Salinisphaera sp. W335]MDT0633774.1 AMP-binding protein [Salinisphaera sp. W335]